MEYQKEMELKVLSKVNELGKVSINEFVNCFPTRHEPHLVFFYNLSEKGDLVKTTEAGDNRFLYFYELNNYGKRKLMELEFEKKIDSKKMHYLRRIFIFAIAAVVGIAIAAWPFIQHWFSRL